MNRLILLLISFAFLAYPTIVISNNFQPWAENVFSYINESYGDKAEARIRHLYNLIQDNQNATTEEKLHLVNDALNKLPWIADQTHWKNADYWATPMETIATFGGDCEDIAIAKWMMLRHFGISARHLRLAYAKIKKTGESHMVLIYIKAPDAPDGQRGRRILDNMTNEVVHPSKRPDLLAVFETDQENEIVLYSDTGDGPPAVAGVYEHRKMRKLDELKQKIADNMKEMQEINHGNPLLVAEKKQ